MTALGMVALNCSNNSLFGHCERMKFRVERHLTHGERLKGCRQSQTALFAE
ncbi:MAG: hypothetical protein IJD28_05660 [Deferribacterales bacterium]|nr:hypothetical protein [Deferribacterales bacterium]